MHCRPRIVLSKCINLEAVRYNGGIVSDDFVRKLGTYVDFIPVCPEVSIGMGIPRPPVILTKGDNNTIRMLEPRTFIDYTENMMQFSKEFLKDLKDVDGFLFKAKSPSCGVQDCYVYDTDRKKILGRTSGLFAKTAAELFPELPIEDEARLRDYWLKYHFLTRIFAFCDLRNNFIEAKTIRELLHFHTRYKYLLMLYNQKKLKEMGNLLANWKHPGLKGVKAAYCILFKKAFQRKPPIRSHYNVMEHIFGHFSDKLNRAEKVHFRALLQKFSEERVVFTTLLEILRQFAYRFDDSFLAEQVYLYPFPVELE